MKSLFRKKDITGLLEQKTPLARTLKTWDLIFLGIGAIIGTGIFVLTGKGALVAGPVLALSFLLAAICCGFAGLCYAKFASMAPDWLTHNHTLLLAKLLLLSLDGT